MKKFKLILLATALILTVKSTFATSGDTLIVSPNLFDSIAVIHFEIANNDTIWLDIFNATGNTIKTYFNGTVLQSGSYNLNFNGDTLPNGIYFVRLKINSTTTLTVKLIKNNNAVGLKENYLLKNIEVYPNPTNSILNITDEQNEFKNAVIQIKNYFGQVVFTTLFTTQINLSNLSVGMYFLTMEDGFNNKMVKIIKE